METGPGRRTGGMVPVLSRRGLNRATLARQWLLARAQLGVAELVEHLVGLQAQTPHSWYAGLWTRLDGFDPRAAAELLARRELVRIALMRGTIHLVTARDCLRLRPLVQPVIERGFKGAFGRQLAGLDLDAVVAAGRELVDARPRTFAELGRALAERWPDRDPSALAQAVRAYVPLVQVPPRGLWGRSGPVAHTSAQAWLGHPLDPDPSLDDLVVRYLAAFGPATVADMQTWSGLTRLREVAEGLRSRLVTLRGEDGAELWDLPEAPRPDPDTPAPTRLLYDFDNLLLSHADRGRVLTDGYHRQQFPATNVMPSIVLVDGFTAATWNITRQGGTATLTVQPFTHLSGADTEDVTTEGRRLLTFAAPGERHDIRFLPPR